MIVVSLLLLAAWASLFDFAVATPVTPRDRESTRTSTNWRREDDFSRWNREDLEDEFKGIWWEKAFQDCKGEGVLDKVIYSTRYMVKMMQKANPEASIEHSLAWGNYFGHYSNWLTEGDVMRRRSVTIHSNIFNAQAFPNKGTLSTSNRVRVWFSCEPHGKALNNCDYGATRAVTAVPGATRWDRWTIFFCPKFFTDDTLEYLEERSKKTERSSEIAFLDTYERVIAHEFMHVDIAGYPDHIKDVKGILPGDSRKMDIYGESRCREFANRKGRANPDVILNADNYAWFFLFHWYEKLWGWKSMDQDALQAGEEVIANAAEDHIEAPSFLEDEDVVEPGTELPANCQMLEGEKDQFDNPKFHCDYVGQNYKEWVANLDKPFQSLGGCELSPECHKAFGYAVDPKCVCRCDDDPLTPLRDERCAGFGGDLPTPKPGRGG